MISNVRKLKSICPFQHKARHGAAWLEGERPDPMPVWVRLAVWGCVRCGLRLDVHFSG